VDSYFSKKFLLELKIFSIRLEDISQVEEKLGTDRIWLRLKIWVGDVFWTASPFTLAKLKNKNLSCNIKQNYRLRIDPEVCNNVTLVLTAIDNAVDGLPDPLKSLRHEVQLGFSQIDVNNIENKTCYIPLNNKNYNEEIYMEPNVPKVSLSMELLSNVKLCEKLVTRECS